jgi:hypothetical protein
VGRAQFHTGGSAGPADTVYLGVYRRAALDRVGGYDEAYLRAEDWEMNHRIRQAGGLIWFQPGLRVTYRPRASARALAVQYFHYGRWRRVVCREHAGTVNLRYLAAPAAVIGMAAGLALGLAGLAAAAAWPGRPPAPAGLAGPTTVTAGHWTALAWLLLGFLIPAAYLGGVLAVTALAARALPPRVLARLPAALVTMHVSWGLGFLTSPRRLVRGRAGRAAPEAGPRRWRGRAGR